MMRASAPDHGGVPTPAPKRTQTLVATRASGRRNCHLGLDVPRDEAVIARDVSGVVPGLALRAGCHRAPSRPTAPARDADSGGAAPRTQPGVFGNAACT
jgi:hypothetical protein